MTTLGATLNALPVGTRLLEFEVEQVLGEGGFAIVYLAFDHSLHRRIALKEYLPAEYAFRHDSPTISIRSPRHRTTFDAGLRSFIEEARFLAQFEHPSLVKVHRVLEDNGTAYMAQGYYAGVTLREMIKASPAFATQSTLKALALPLLGAVELLHSRQCIHRDIAPDNIIVQPNGVPVLLDFGAARRIIGDMTQALTAILKPSYAPIEQYTEEAGLAQGPWTDVYALAAVLRAAITGKPPPAAPGRAVNDTLVPLHTSLPAGYDLRFLNGVDAGLAVLPRDRPQSIAAFRKELGLVADGPRPTTANGARSAVYTPATTRTTDFAPAPKALAPLAPAVAPAPKAPPTALAGSPSPDAVSSSPPDLRHAASAPEPAGMDTVAATTIAGSVPVVAPGGDETAPPAATTPHVAEATPAQVERGSRPPMDRERTSIDTEVPRAAAPVRVAPAARRRRLLLPLTLLMIGIAVALYAYNFSGRENVRVTASREPRPDAAVSPLPGDAPGSGAVATKADTPVASISSAPSAVEPPARALVPAPSSALPADGARSPVARTTAGEAPGATSGGVPSNPERALPAPAAPPVTSRTESPSANTSGPATRTSPPAIGSAKSETPARPAPARASAGAPTSPVPPSTLPAAGAERGATRASQAARHEQAAGPTAAGAATSAGPPAEPARTASVSPDNAVAKASAAHSMVRISGADPEYPREAIRSGVTSGRVVARVHVDERGNVVDVAIRTSSPSRVFDRAARAALQGWKFRADGAKYEGDVEINFKLKDE